MQKRFTIALIFVLACAVRIFAVLHWFNAEETRHLDFSEYIVLAENLRFHGTFSFGAPHRWGEDPQVHATGPFIPSAARAPLYPAAIAALWWSEDPPFAAVLALQVMLGSFTAFLVYWIAHDSFGPRSALVAVLVMALAPM